MLAGFVSACKVMVPGANKLRVSHTRKFCANTYFGVTTVRTRRAFGTVEFINSEGRGPNMRFLKVLPVSRVTEDICS